MESISAPTNIVSINDCEASQLIGQEVLKIAAGTLSLDQYGTGTDDARLVLKIEGASFALPIEKDAVVGTRGDRSYIFSNKLAPAAKTKPAASNSESDLKDVPLEDNEKDSVEEPVIMVQIDMPSTASEADLTQFERCLVEHGFLFTGTQADADNLSRSFLEWTGLKTKDLSSYALRNTTPGKQTDQPTAFSDTTHSIASGSASGSSSVAQAATKIGQTINSGMAGIGSFIGSTIGTKGIFSGPGHDETGVKKDVKEAFSDGAESFQIVGSGIAEGVSHMASEASTVGTKAVEHNYGADAAKIKEHTDTTLSNAGSVGVTAFKQSSMIMHGAEVGRGAVTED